MKKNTRAAGGLVVTPDDLRMLGRVIGGFLEEHPGKRHSNTTIAELIDWAARPAAPVEVVLLCEATLLCTGTASHLCRIVDPRDGGRRSRPIPVCTEHRAYIKEQAAHTRQTVTEEPIAASSWMAPAGAGQ
jgi:hypothetical protein